MAPIGSEDEEVGKPRAASAAVTATALIIDIVIVVIAMTVAPTVARLST